MKKIELGQRIHCILYGGRDGTVFNIHGEQSPESVSTIGNGVITTGGYARFDVVWDDGSSSKQVPESIIKGVQWRVLDEPLASPDEIQERLAYQAKVEEDALLAKANEKIRFDAETERLKKEYPHLLQADSASEGGKFVAKNLRILLKNAFPGAKFSITSDYSVVRVKWEDGPTEHSVKQITNKFKEVEDHYKYSDSPWNCLFGSVGYLFTDRELSDELYEKCLDRLYEHFAPDMSNIPRRPAAELRGDRHASFPNVDITISEAMRAIACCTDARTGELDLEAIGYKNRWIVESIVKKEEEEAGAPAPSM